LVSAAGRAWHRFFFTPADPTPLGVIRIAVGLLALWNFLNIGIDLHNLLGRDGWVSPEALRHFWREWKTGTTVWTFWLWVPDRFLTPTWAMCMLVIVLFTLGVWSRATAVLTWVIMVSAIRRIPVIYFGFDETLLTWVMYLAVSFASGQALSVDRLLERRRRSAANSATPPPPTVSANLGLRLIQLHLCLIYGAAGLAKLQGPAWWTGKAALVILISPEFRVRDLVWLAAYPRFLNLLTHATVAFEILYPVLIWVRVLRPIMIIAMIGLHLGIDQTLGLTEFCLAMIAGNVAFIPGALLRGRA
jgi:hypothetical protein